MRMCTFLQFYVVVFVSQRKSMAMVFVCFCNPSDPSTFSFANLLSLSLQIVFDYIMQLLPDSTVVSPTTTRDVSLSPNASTYYMLATTICFPAWCVAYAWCLVHPICFTTFQVHVSAGGERARGSPSSSEIIGWTAAPTCK